MIDIDRYKKLKEDLGEMKNKLVKTETLIGVLQGERKKVVDQLKADYGVKTLQEARDSLALKEKELAGFLDEVESRLSQIKTADFSGDEFEVDNDIL